MMEFLKACLYVSIILDGFLLIWKLNAIIDEKRARNKIMEEQNILLEELIKTLKNKK